MLIASNIWKIFYLILLSGTFLVLTLLYVNYNEINDRYHIQIQHYTELLSKSVNSDFLQKDMVLGIIGKQLFKNNNYKDIQKSKLILDDLLKQNPYLVSFGLADVNGNVILSSSNIKINPNKNLLIDAVTSNDFKESLISENMVVAKTYYFKTIKEWIIPLRKAIRDKNGNVLGVVIAGIKNTNKGHYLDTLELSKNITIEITKDFDSNKKVYRQYYTNHENISYEELYNDHIPDKAVQSVNSGLQKKYNYSFDKLRKNAKTLTIEATNPLEKNMIFSITYDSRYHLWITVQVSKLEVMYEFYYNALLYLILFTIISLAFYVLFYNISTSEKRKNKELVFQAQHDTLTNLPNRTYMYTNIKEWKKTHAQKYYVLFLDLDNFKNINDKFGHTIGDKILVEVAQRLEKFFNVGDMLVRQGGDEFIVLKEGIEEKELELQVQEVIQIVSKTYHVNSKEFRVGVSLGIAQYPIDALSIEELLSLSDTAMYEAKKHKNSYCLFSEKMRHSSVVKSDIEQELRGAIENNELWMAYQPQINSDGSLYGVEALIRWENEKLGFVGPDKFIPVAEETGLMKELGEFIIYSSLRDIKNIRDELDLSFNLSINISVVQLMEADFLSNLLKAVEIENFTRTCLTLEITESLSIESLDDVLPLLDDIQEYGIQISLDDFGTGYSSLSILRDLPINELKIDKSFIDKILYDESEKALVQSIINIGKNFNMKTLAEGVESDEQIKVLKAAHCDIFQGYYYSKPLSKENLIEFLNKEII
ncbi:EAL domain-containing protein [Sulfurimonas sp.]|uniref:bifunctional diguanylate cyclase/phosphodiesterase n=1 Tax=Sulfurimonas sp. TaxID=2022749 RepID=UPI0025EA9276|nr:EAL domain-containing protein [Sulfurimonas sp.]